jgi:two-component system, chemotaxis family, sensor kinase CheA
VVIKSLEANYRHVVGIAAATILGDGRVALILDVDAIVARRTPDNSLAA